MSSPQICRSLLTLRRGSMMAMIVSDPQHFKSSSPCLQLLCASWSLVHSVLGVLEEMV